MILWPQRNSDLTSGNLAFNKNVGLNASQKLGYNNRVVIFKSDNVCVCVCVCRERGGGKVGERERISPQHIHVLIVRDKL